MKKGVSNIVAVVLILLISIAAISLLWSSVIPMMQDSIDFEERADLTIQSLGFTFYDPVNNISCIQVKRGSDKAELSGIGVLFYFLGSTMDGNFSGNEIPSINQAKTKCFNMSGFGKPDEIKIYPIYSNGKTGEVVSSIKNLPIGSYSSNLGEVAGIYIRQGQISNSCQGVVCTPGECQTNARCVSGMCLYDNKTAGTSCSSGVCDGNGGCVECLEDSHCSDGEYCNSQNCEFGLNGNMIMTCGVSLMNSGEYSLANSVEAWDNGGNSGGICIKVLSNNVKILGNDRVIEGNRDSSSEFGVYSLGYSGIEISDLKVFGFFDSGIYFNNVNNSRLIDVEAKNNGKGIYMQSSMNNTFYQILLESNQLGIYFEQCNYNNFTDITANLNLESGVYFEQSNYNNLSDFNVNGLGAGNSEYGIWLKESDYNNLVNINQGNSGLDGILIDYSDNNIIENSSFNAPIDDCLNLVGGNNNIFKNIYVSGGSSGVITGDSSGNFFINVTATFNNNGFSVYSNLDNFINNTACYNSQYDFYCESLGFSGTGNYFGEGNVDVCDDGSPIYEGNYRYCSEL